MSDLPPWDLPDDDNPNASNQDDFGDVDWGTGNSSQPDSADYDPTKGLTGNLPWNAQASDPADDPNLANHDDSIAWLDNAGDDSDPDTNLDEDSFDFTLGDDDDDSLLEEFPEWLDDDSDDLNPVPAKPSSDLDADTAPEEDWMAGIDFGDDGDIPDAPTPVADPGDGDAMPDWLNADVSNFTEQSTEPTDAEEEGFDFDAYTDPLADAEEEGSFEDWAAANDADDFGSWSGQEDEGDLTYAEWEEQQAQADLPSEPEIELPDFDMPDLDDLSAEGDSGVTPAGGDYVPEWFMGVEELDTSDAPDWLKDMNAPSSGAPAPPPSAADAALPNTGDLMPDFDSVMGDDIAGVDDLLPPSDALPNTGDLMPDFDSVMGATGGDDALPASDALPNTGDLMPDFDSVMGDGMAGVDDLLPSEPVADDGIQRLDTSATASGGSDGFDDDFAELFADDLDAVDDIDLDADPDWLTAEDDAPTGAPAADGESKSASQTGDLPEWFGNIDFSEIEAPDIESESALPVPDNALFANDVSPANDADPLDFDSLFDDSDMALTTTDTSVAGGVDELSDLSFDDDFLNDFAIPEASAPASDTEPTGDADFFGIDAGDIPAAEPINLSEDLPLDEPLELAQNEAIPEWMRQQIGTSSDDVVLSAGGVQGRFAQVPDAALPADLRSLQAEAQSYIAGTKDDAIAIEGPLAGVEGALILKESIAQPGKIKLGETYFPPDEQQIRLDTLRDVLEVVKEESSLQPDVGVELGLGFDLDDDEEDVEAVVATATPKKRRRTATRKMDRVVISLVLFVVVLLPFLVDALHFGDDPTTATLRSESEALVAAIDDLATDTSSAPPLVLVAFEYGSTAAYELDPLAEAVLRDIVVQGGKPVLVSTNPMGTLNAQKVMRNLATDETLIAYRQERAEATLSEQAPLFTPSVAPATWFVEPLPWENGNWFGDRARQQLLEQTAISDGANLVNNKDYVILPFVSGGAVGVRLLTFTETAGFTTFTQGVAGENTNLDVEGITDDAFEFVIVIGEQYTDVQTWAEQLSSIDVPKYILTTSATEPLTRPYLASESYQGMLSGVQDALTYDAVRNAETKATYDDSQTLPNPELARFYSSTFGIMIALLIITGGAAINILRVLFRMRRQS